MFFHHRRQFWGIPGEVRAICFGGVASPILDTAGYNPSKTAPKFWQPAEAQKRNQYRLECYRDLPAEVPWKAWKKFWSLNLLEL